MKSVNLEIVVTDLCEQGILMDYRWPADIPPYTPFRLTWVQLRAIEARPHSIPFTFSLIWEDIDRCEFVAVRTDFLNIEGKPLSPIEEIQRWRSWRKQKALQPSKGEINEH